MNEIPDQPREFVVIPALWGPLEQWLAGRGVRLVQVPAGPVTGTCGCEQLSEPFWIAQPTGGLS